MFSIMCLYSRLFHRQFTNWTLSLVTVISTHLVLPETTKKINYLDFVEEIYSVLFKYYVRNVLKLVFSRKFST